MIVMNNSSLSRFVMRTPLLALLLPLCLTACLETTSQDAPTNSVNELKEVPHKEVPQQTSSENRVLFHCRDHNTKPIMYFLNYHLHATVSTEISSVISMHA